MANDHLNKCKECGCKCKKCGTNDHDVHLHVEIENLKQKLVERDSHIATMETNVLNEANKFPNGEFVALQEELLTWQDKYRRLYDAHRRIQRVNQGLEDKLLRLVDVCETEKNALTKDIATVSHKLAEANYSIKKLTEDNERYKNDVSIAIQFLQCKQGNFVSQKLDSLPNEVQAKVSSYVMGKRKPEEKKVPEVKSIKVPIPTFPPTAMVYSIPKYAPEDHPRDPDSPEVDIVSAAIMAKVLEERERERALAKHCDTCTCSKTLKIVHEHFTHTIGTQTQNTDDFYCSSCNTFVDNEPFIKIVKDTSSSKMAKSMQISVCDNEDKNFINKSKSLVVKVEPNNYLNNAEILDQEETPLLENKPVIPKAQSLQVFQTDTCAKNKGPIYCSVRLQNGSKNILLDNVHNNISPVLYTRANEKLLKSSNTKVTHNFTSYSEDETNLLPLQSRNDISEWICNIDEYNSNSVIDPARYAEMENNVKKFLFGESQLQHFSKEELDQDESFRIYQSNSHTVTEI